MASSAGLRGLFHFQGDVKSSRSMQGDFFCDVWICSCIEAEEAGGDATGSPLAVSTTEVVLCR